MNDVKTPTKQPTSVVDEQALGTVYNADTPAEADTQPLAEAGAPMQTEAPLPQVAPTDTAMPPNEADLASRLAEAEQRGYLRGRNEAVHLAMERPAMWQVAGSDLHAEPPTESDAAFLRHIRPSIWD